MLTGVSKIGFGKGWVYVSLSEVLLIIENRFGNVGGFRMHGCMMIGLFIGVFPAKSFHSPHHINTALAAHGQELEDLKFTSAVPRIKSLSSIYNKNIGSNPTWIAITAIPLSAWNA